MICQFTSLLTSVQLSNGEMEIWKRKLFLPKFGIRFRFAGCGTDDGFPAHGLTHAGVEPGAADSGPRGHQREPRGSTSSSEAPHDMADNVSNVPEHASDKEDTGLEGTASTPRLSSTDSSTSTLPRRPKLLFLLGYRRREVGGLSLSSGCM